MYARVYLKLFVSFFFSPTSILVRLVRRVMFRATTTTTTTCAVCRWSRRRRGEGGGVKVKKTREIARVRARPVCRKPNKKYVWKKKKQKLYENTNAVKLEYVCPGHVCRWHYRNYNVNTTRNRANVEFSKSEFSQAGIQGAGTVGYCREP